MRSRLALPMLLWTLPAAAGDAAVGASIEISGRSSTESTKSSVRAEIEADEEERRQRALKRAGVPDGAACRTASECRSGVCEAQRCVGPPAPVPPPPRGGACRDARECAPNQSCVEGQCVSPPPPPPPVTLRRRATELLLRDRATQLREDLALGEGPVISTLALGRRTPPAALGRLMRAHQRELSALIGDSAGAGADWPSRFLDRLEVLIASTAPGEPLRAQRE